MAIELTFDLDTGKTIAPPTQASAGRQISDRVQLSEDLYRNYKARADTWRRAAQEDADFRNNAQFTKQQEQVLTAKGHAAIPTNVLHPAVEQAKAILTANAPRFVAVGREGSDVKMASMFSELLTYVWEQSSGNIELKQCVDDYYVKGMGVMMAYVDPAADFGKGEVFVKAIDPLLLFIDPNSTDIFCRDAAHMLVAKIMTHEQLQRSFPGMKGKLKNAEEYNAVQLNQETYNNLVGGVKDASDISADPTHRRYLVLDRYSRITASMTRIMDLNGMLERILAPEDLSAFLEEPAFIEMNAQQQMNFFIAPDDVAAEMALYQQMGDQYHWAQRMDTGEVIQVPGPEDQAADAAQGLMTQPGSTITIIQVTMKDLIEMGALVAEQVPVGRIQRLLSVGGVELYFGVLPIEDYPIVPFMNRHNRNPYPMSDVRFVKPIQEFINKLRSLIIAHATSSTGNKLLIPRGSMDRQELIKEWEKAGPAVIEYDPELGAPVISGPTALPNGTFQLFAEAKQDVYDILGIYPLMQGDPSKAPDTYKGTVAIDEYGQRRLKSKKDDIESGLNQLARVVVPLIQKTYIYHKVIRIAQPNNDVREFQINGILEDPTEGTQKKFNDITVGKYDLVMVSGSTLPVNRWALVQQYLELFDRAIVDDIEVLKKTEVVDAPAVAERVARIKRMAQELEAATKQIKDLEGDLQTARREAVHANQRTELEKYKASLAGLNADATAMTEVFTQRLMDELAMAKREAKLNNKAKAP